MLSFRNNRFSNKKEKRNIIKQNDIYNKKFRMKISKYFISRDIVLLKEFHK